MTVLIEAEGLRKTFGAINAVDGISLTVKKGEVLGFLGPNGAGKSTTMKMITGFLEPDAGSSKLCGTDVTRDPKAAKRQLGYLPEGAPAYGEMTPEGFLRFIAELRGYRGSDIATRVAAAVARAGLEQVLHQRIETLSKGYKRRVGIAQAILHDPPVLIMDEPTDGLDPNQKYHVRKLIRDMAADKAIIVSTHILEEVEAVCTRAVIINKGRIVADGTAEELMERMPNHRSVAIRVPATHAEKVLTLLGSRSELARVERTAKAHGIVDLRAVPRNGTDPTAAITKLLKDNSLPFEEVYLERAKLDDVFRAMTMSGEK